MDRKSFVATSAGAATLAMVPGGAWADFTQRRATTQQALFDRLPRPRAGEWVRIIMGSGVDYQKQIGFGTESSEHGELRFVETQIGTPGGSCNPNTLKRVYLRQARFGSLLAQDPVVANVANSGTTLTRWGDVAGGQPQQPSDARLRLLDAAYLYDTRPCRVTSVSRQSLALPFGAVETSHIVARFDPPYDERHRLTAIELWAAPDLPYGVAKLRATVAGREPFELHVFSHGHGFQSDLHMSLDTVRAITPDGTHVETS
jgi:hypothetical protein